MSTHRSPQVHRNRHYPAAFAAVGALAISSLSGAATAAEWSSTNVQLLTGSEYADDFGIDQKNHSVFTFEHASGWKYGDNFFFVDVVNPNHKGTTYYSEFSPRFSLGKLAGKDMSFGIVKDVLAAGTLEMGSELRSYLFGVGLALDLPHFAFADLNVYVRKSERDFVADQTDTGAQITVDWLLPFEAQGMKFAFEGFADYAFGEKGGSAPKENNLVTAPRLLIDVGNFWGAPNTLQAGIEYQIWRNKYGIDGVDENVVQAMVKWTL